MVQGGVELLMIYLGFHILSIERIDGFEEGLRSEGLVWEVAQLTTRNNLGLVGGG